MLKKITTLLFIAILATTSFAQKKSKSDKDAEVEEKVKSPLTSDSTVIKILDGINSMRKEVKLDELSFNDVLAEASAIQSEDMAAVGKASLTNSSGKYATTGKRLKSVGGTEKAEELVISLAALKSKKELTPEELVEGILKKWKGKKEKAIITNPNFVYASPTVTLDESGKKVFVSVVFGSFNSFNKGAGKKLRKSLKPTKYTKKNKGLTGPTDKACKGCAKFKDYEALYDGIYLEGKEVYIKYDNMKTFFRLISKPTDGLAIDIVQKSQYAHPDYNILDNNLLSKGMISKTVTKNSFKDLNRAELQEGERKVSTIDVLMGKLHKKLTGDYEINLLVIKDGSVCKTITKSYVEQGDQDSNTKLDMLLMPDSAAYFKPMFVPQADSAKLSFNVPFEKNKSEYKEEDMTPFLNSLQEPDFIINKLDIVAYSSIEGDSVQNVKLQEKRSGNIINALKGMQKQGVVSSVKTSDSWEMFKESMVGGEYDTLSKMPKNIVIEQINTTPGLSDSLEPYLSKQRFAEIHMEVTYDISGAKEEKFSVTKFNQAVKKGDVQKAYKIQYYIGQKVKEKKYSKEVFANMKIEPTEKSSGLINNQIVMDYNLKNKVANKEHYEKLKDIVKVDSSNGYAVFNYVFCALKFEEGIGSDNERIAFQNKIDGLYSSTIPKKLIDALNIEWQFKVIETVDTLEGSEPIIEACNEKVKSFYDLKNATWENSLKLSYVFSRFKDYKYASKLLKPFLAQPTPNEELLFAYVSYCAQVPELMKTQAFVTAMKKAEKANHERYCKLFGAPFLSFQVLDHPDIKDHYKKVGCKFD